MRHSCGPLTEEGIVTNLLKTTIEKCPDPRTMFCRMRLSVCAIVRLLPLHVQLSDVNTTIDLFGLNSRCKVQSIIEHVSIKVSNEAEERPISYIQTS